MKKKKEYLGNPIFEKNDKWFFWDETWTESHGPYDNEEQAIEGCKKYAETL